MNAESKLNELFNAKLAKAEKHAHACLVTLERHASRVKGDGGEYVAGCLYGCHSYGQILQIATRCEIGMACKEEYEIATRRVREVKLMQEFIERGEAFSTLEQTLDMLESALAECKAVQS